MDTTSAGRADAFRGENAIRFEWHEQKRLANLERHGLDFRAADVLFAGPLISAEAKTVGRERRELATGLIDDVYVTAIFTVRGDVVRLISRRRARDGERRRHQAIHGG